MTQVNMLEAKTELYTPQKEADRIGAAEGKFKVPDEFDAWDKEVEEMFGGEI